MIPSSHSTYILNGAVATSVQFVFPSPPRDPGMYDITYPLYQGWVNTATKGIWYLEAFSSLNGVVTASWRAVAPIVVTASTDPTTSDYLYPIGQSWVNETGNNYWVLVQVVGTTATWIELTSGGPSSELFAVDTVSGTGVNPVVPDVNGEIFLTGSVTTFTISPSPNTIRTEVQSTTNTLLIGQGTNAASIASNAPSVGSVLTQSGGVPTFSDAVVSTASGANFAFTTSTAGVTRSVTISNSDTSSVSSQAALLAQVGGDSVGDAWFTAGIAGLSGYSWGIDNSDSDKLKETASNAGPSQTPVLRTMTVGGQQNLPLQSSFSATLSTNHTNATGDGTAYTIPFNNTLYDQNSEFNTGTGVATFKQPGKYLFTVTIAIGNIGAGHTLAQGELTVGTTPLSNFIFDLSPAAVQDSSDVFVGSGSFLLPVATSDTASVTIKVSGSTKTITVLGAADTTPPYCSFGATMIA